ncbi:MAG: CHAT domain-containing protein, partial [Ilumatobacteraceae bacterium]
FAAAEDGYRQVGSLDDLPRLRADHALALADANLLDDAEQLIDSAVDLSTTSGNDLETAELLLVSAEIDLALGKPDEAVTSATEAGVSFGRQGRESWLHVADRLRLQAEARLDPHDLRVADGLVANAEALAAGGWRSEALGAVLLAALLHTRSGREDRATALLTAAGPEASRGRATDRILLSHVLALLAERQGRRTVARRTVTAGLRVAQAAQAALGSLETRSHAAQHGAELIEIGARLAIADRRPRELLHRIEAMRTMMWHAPLVRPPDDAAMAQLLTELRRLDALVDDPDSPVEGRRAAELERLRVERTIRGLARRARGDRTTGRGAFTTTDRAVADAIADLAALGDHQLVAYANVGGALVAVSADRGRTKLHQLGSVDTLGEHLEACSFALHRLNRAQGSEASRAAAMDMLDDATAALAAQLLPRTVRRSDRPLVVVPTGVLHGVPWTAFEVLRGRAVAVSPSLSAWSVAARGAAARATRRFADGTSERREQPSGFVAGPALRFAESEVRLLASSYERSVVLAGTAATVDGCLDLFGAADMVHLACHGAFRSDNPLFSTLTMVDGPLTVYDLQRVARLPEIVVLSACSVAASAAINGGTLLGLSSALGAFGASDVVAPLTPVNDEGVTAVMQRFHDGLAAGLSPSVALAGAAVRPDGGLDPVAAAFVVIGA